MSETESKGEKAWNWFMRFLGAGVFAYGAFVPQGEIGYFYGFMGICLAFLSPSDIRSLLRNWRNGGKET